MNGSETGREPNPVSNLDNLVPLAPLCCWYLLPAADKTAASGCSVQDFIFSSEREGTATLLLKRESDEGFWVRPAVWRSRFRSASAFFRFSPGFFYPPLLPAPLTHVSLAATHTLAQKIRLIGSGMLLK